jgi:hypothetical protein
MDRQIWDRQRDTRRRSPRPAAPACPTPSRVRIGRDVRCQVLPTSLCAFKADTPKPVRRFGSGTAPSRRDSRLGGGLFRAKPSAGGCPDRSLRQPRLRIHIFELSLKNKEIYGIHNDATREAANIKVGLLGNHSAFEGKSKRRMWHLVGAQGLRRKYIVKAVLLFAVALLERRNSILFCDQLCPIV